MTTLLPVPVTRQPLKAPRRIVIGLIGVWSALTIVYALTGVLTAVQPHLIVDPSQVDDSNLPPDFVVIAMVFWWLSFLLLPNAMILTLMMRRWPRCPSAVNRITAVGAVLASAVTAVVINHLAIDPLPVDTAAGLLCVVALATPAIVWWLLKPTDS